MTASDALTHDQILLLSVEQFTKMNFCPPYVLILIERTRNIAESCDNMWREYITPQRIEEKEKLLEIFYEEANRCFAEKEKKMIFTLTMLKLVKALSDSKFVSVHPFNRKDNLRLHFNLHDAFFAIPFYNFIFDWFSFERDWRKMLLLMTKMLEIKAASQRSNDVKWVNFPRPMNFKHATVIFARKNPFSKRAKSPSRVKCCICMQADRGMISAIKDFMETAEFDWEKIASDFSVNFEFANFRSKVCELKKIE